MGLPVVTIRKRSEPKQKPKPVKESLATRRQRESKRLMIAALQKYKGNVVQAAGEVGISRMTHYRWTRDDPEYAQAFDDIVQGVVDNVESLFLKTMVSEKCLRSMRWFLERKGKDRGYGKPSVLSLGDGGELSGNVGGINIGTVVNIRAELPGSSVLHALKDVLQSNPELARHVGLPVPNDDAAIDTDAEELEDDDSDEELE